MSSSIGEQGGAFQRNDPSRPAAPDPAADPDPAAAGSDPTLTTPPASAVTTWLRRFPGLSPTSLAYLIGPVAFVVILVMMKLNVMARESVWLWLAVFAAIPVASFVCDRLYLRRPSARRLHLRVGASAASVAIVIYLSGWGPALVLAFAFLALENIAAGGSRVWRVTAFWSLLAIALAQVAVWQHWAPSYLSTPRANALALMGAFILFFVIRMAGVVMEQKEKAEREMVLSEDRFRSLIQNSSDITIVIGEGGILTYVSPVVLQLLGFQPEELVGRRATDIVHADDHEYVRNRFAPDPASASNQSFLQQFRMQKKDGTYRNVEAVITDQRDRPSIGGYVANVRDITERKEFEALLAHQALHDSLTGLANRQLTVDRADQMLLRSRRSDDPVALCFIDLDNFKDTNDSLGHEAGDRLLCAVAARFTTMLRAGDTVGRLGGDEFVILTEGASLADGPLFVAERIRDVLHEPFELEGYEGLPINVTASVGIATGDRPSAQELLRDADVALYQAKAVGKDCCVLFEPEMQSAAVDRLALKSNLYSALANNQFFLLYQPIFDLRAMTIHGVEALLRWQHPTRGVISPDEFIPVLEENGLIVDVGRWVLHQACNQAAEWAAMGYRIQMSVNVSMRQLASPGLVIEVQEALAMSRLDPGALTLEVTESVLMRDADATVAHLRHLKELGVMIAIDDFGSGQSSLTYLRRFPIDELKIDRSFIAAIDSTRESVALLHTLVELGRTLGLLTVAEGIETVAQLEGLRGEQCAFGQGFIFARPQAPSAVEGLLARSALLGATAGHQLQAASTSLARLAEAFLGEG
jgi:diguanylate cyclase (GGDEF)-like protein/PAS domain S-box-containing protein